MNLMPLEKLGPRVNEQNASVAFGVYLPWVRATDGNRLYVKIIHESDQFLQGIQAKVFPLSQLAVDPQYGEYWGGDVSLTSAADTSGSHWGAPGRYLYRFVLNNPAVGEIDWIIDPFAREFGIGKISAFTLGYDPYCWSAGESTWRTPALSDLVVYELNIIEFAGSLDRSIERLPYLQDLGINCIEIMPVSDVSDATVQGYWGYTPVGYFGVDARFGRRFDFQRFVDAAHQHGIAVVLDVVYGHVGDDFPYQYLYKNLKYRENPFMRGNGDFGILTDFNRQITQDFFFTANCHWLDCYHIDGFRYDSVAEYWDSADPGQRSFGALVYATYQDTKTRVAKGGAWARFAGATELRLIQCAENLKYPIATLTDSYANSTWQNATLASANEDANGVPGALDALGQQWGAVGYPSSVTMNGETITKLPMQYIENHDHQRFICNFGLVAADKQALDIDSLLQTGDRAANWFKVQPYLIGLLTSKGVPLLWQGQELMENYWIPEGVYEGRVQVLRPTRWDYFYDTYGLATIDLVRRLLRLRKSRDELRSGEHFFYNEPECYQFKGLLLFSRWTTTPRSFSLVALNFSGSDATAPFWFPFAGNYVEQLHANPDDTLRHVTPDQPVNLLIPSNYGRVWSS